MSDAADTAAPSNREKPDCRRRRALELAIRQLITGITALFVLLLIGIIALSFVITFKEHYETTGAFIDLAVDSLAIFCTRVCGAFDRYPLHR